SPNPIGHVHFLLSADSKFTQEGHHRAPVGKSRLKQIQANKSGEKVPVRAYVVPKCQGQQDKAASDQTKCAFYSHSSPPSKQVGPTQFHVAVFRIQRHFPAHADASLEASLPSERGSKEPALPSAKEPWTQLLLPLMTEPNPGKSDQRGSRSLQPPRRLRSAALDGNARPPHRLRHPA